MNRTHLSIVAVGVVSFVAIAFPAFLELGLAVCPPAMYYTVYWLFWSSALLPLLLYRPSRLKFIFYGLLTFSLLGLYLIPWNSRKPFLRDLSRVHIGMTVSEVELIMGDYIKGTGWSIPPGYASSTGTLNEVGSGVTVATHSTPSGELAIQDSITYRHSNDGAFNSDWGVVQFKDGKVVSKDFMPD